MTKPSRLMSQGREARSGSSLRMERAFMLPKPERPQGRMEASEPPQMMASASPNLMMRQASPMLLLEVAQAVVMHMFGPMKPNSVAIMPVAMFVIIMGMRKGLTRPGPLLRRTSYCVSMVLRPPMPLPTMTPMR